MSAWASISVNPASAPLPLDRGAALIRWEMGQCREQGCGLVRLTTDKARVKARRFYDRLGFEASHLGCMRML